MDMNNNRQFNNDGTEIGATPILTETTKRRRKPWLKIAIILIVVGLVFTAIGAATGALNPGESVSASLQPISHIDIRTGSAAIVVVEGSEFSIEFRDISNTNYRIDNGRLVFDYTGRNTGTFNIVGVNVRRPQVTVVVPRGHTYTLDLQASSGSIRVEDLNFDTANVRSSSGSIRLYNITANQLATSASSGSIRLTNVTADGLSARASSGSVRLNNVDAGTTELSASSGAIRVEGLDFRHLTAETSSGSIRVENARPMLDSVANLRATSGSIRFDTAGGRQNTGLSTSATSGTIRIDGDCVQGGTSAAAGSLHTVSARTTSGSIRINFI